MSDNSVAGGKITENKESHHNVEILYVPKNVKKYNGNNHDDEKDDEKKSEVWKSCCFEIDPHATAYAGQFIFSMSVLSFCAVMLVKSDGDCNKGSPYINIISFMMGKILHAVVSSASN